MSCTFALLLEQWTYLASRLLAVLKDARGMLFTDALQVLFIPVVATGFNLAQPPALFMQR